MPFASTHTISLEGAAGHLVDVQVDVSAGMVSTSLVGRPDKAISEAKDRCRTAVVNSGFTWPATRRLTVLLSPADLPKHGPHFDLAIAVGVVAASTDGFPLGSLEDTVFLGELTLDGRLRPVPAVLPMVMAAARRGVRRVFVAEPQLTEARLVPGMEVFGVRSLGQAVAVLRGHECPEAPPVDPITGTAVLSWRGEERLDDVDLADLAGMEEAKYAVEVAAAGGHHLLLSGPKGAGKTSLAERIPGILPDLTIEEALELTAVQSLAGVLDTSTGLVNRPPFFAPHHSATRASLLGGGTGKVRPGELSRAHCGVLLLDEFPLLPQDVIEALRQPLESGEITIARGEETATYPARGMFVLAANPCRCGGYTANPGVDHCTCKEVVRRDYRAKLEGPVIDRIDITRHVLPVSEYEAKDPLACPERSAVVRERVARARDVQAERYVDRTWRLNAQVPGQALRTEFSLEPDGATLLDEAMYAGRISRRGAVRVHRLAWTIADLDGVLRPGERETRLALALRLGDPLPARSWQRRCVG